MSVYLDTEYSACSAEFSTASPDLLALGLYQIAADAANPNSTAESPATKRLGRCLLFDTAEKSFNEVGRQDMPAVLDMKWGTLQETSVLAIANAKGAITLHSMAHATQDKALETGRTVQYAEPSTLSLSLDWSNRKFHNFAPEIVVSNSSGQIYILSGADLSQVTEQWDAHGFEPWIAAWDCWSNHVIYTGGDDCLLKVWDRRQGFDQPVLENKRFDAGVTAIQSHIHDEHLVAVGSYDANLRVFDKRNLRRPVAEHDVGGGIWRVKWHPSEARKQDLLVACMHDGYKVVHLSSSSGSDPAITTQSENREHESLAYGADWTQRADGTTLVGTASFYDHAARLWEA